MANPAPTINQINAFNATQGTTIDFNIIGGTELVRSNRIYIYDLSDNSLICTHLYVSTESIHELPANTDGSIVYESGKSSADFVNGAQYYAQIQTYTNTAGTEGGSGLSVAKMFWCLNNPTLTIGTIPSTISTTSYNVSATYNANTNVVSNIIQQYQFNLYNAIGSLLQSSGVIVGNGEQQGTGTLYDISYNFTGLSVGSSYYVTVEVTTTQGMNVIAQSGTFTVSIETPTLGEATVVNNTCDGYISVTSNLSSEYGGSASGEIASFVTDSINNISSLRVSLDPIQDLNGYDAPWVGGAGKNLIENTLSSSTLNGVVWTKNADGTITANNTATANSTRSFVFNIPAGDYYFNGCPSGGSNTKYDVYIWDNTTNARAKQWDGTTAVVSDFGSNNNNQVQILSGHNYTYNCRVISGYNAQNIVFKPMIRKSTETDGTWQPYENICPISGHTEVDVLNDPKYGGFIEWNQLVRNGDFSDGTTGWSVTKGTLSASDNVLTCTRSETGFVTIGRQWSDSYDVQNHKCFVAFDVSVSNTSLSIRGSISNASINTNTFENGTTLAQTNTFYRKEYIYTPTSSGAYYLRIGADMASINGTISLKNVIVVDLTKCFGAGNEPSTVADFKALFAKSYYAYDSGTTTCVSAVNGDPYETYTTPLGQTVYGGTLDLVSGELTVDRVKLRLGDLSWAYDNTGPRFISATTEDLSYLKAPTSSAERPEKSISSYFNLVTQNELGNAPTGSYMLSTGKRISVKDLRYTASTDFKNNNADAEFIFALATPQTYQLTPQQIQTLVGENNVWSEQGDVELSYHIPITNLLVKRQDVADVSGDWLTLYSQPITQASDMDFTFIDFTNQYGKTYKYALVPLLTQTQSGVEVEVEGGYTVSDEVQSVFDGVFIVDSTGSQKCKANVGYGNVDMNQTVGTITPIGAKYPVVITNSKNQYHNGSISGMIVPDDYYFNGNLSRIDMVNKRDELEQFLTNKRAKIIKDWNGKIWLVMIMDNVSCTFNNNYGMGIVNFSTSWVEVGDPTNQQDLQATGLIDVGGA